MNQPVSFSATNSQTEPSRIERLKEVLAIYTTKISTINFYQLHDHKGELTVYWSTIPSNDERSTIELTWEEQNELRENVVHEVDEIKLIL